MSEAAHIADHTPHQVDGRSTGERDVPLSLLRGALKRCPACGKGNIYKRYLKLVDYCPHCGEGLYHQRADDAPSYFTVVITGHLIVASVMVVEMTFHPPLWVHALLWLPMTIIVALTLLPRVKGALVGLQWALLMHGFDPDDDAASYAAPSAGEPGGSSYFPPQA